MESIENQIEQLSRGSADAKDVAAVKDDAYKERLTTIERSIGSCASQHSKLSW